MKKDLFRLFKRIIYSLKMMLLAICACISCSSAASDLDPQEDNPPASIPSFDKVKSIIYNAPQDNYVMVLAHRGGFATTAENSIAAIQNSIDMGVDIVELDVRISKDGHLIIMHDETINRTTNGTGKVSDYTLAELKQFKLVLPNGAVSNEFIPSLKDALAYSKNKMHLFIDKGDDYLDLIYADMLATNTVDQTLMGGTLFFSIFKQKYPTIWDKINYIPRAGTGQSLTYITDFETGINPIGYFPSCGLISSNSPVFNKIKEYNTWMFSETLNGGGSNNCSEEALGGENIWNWEIQQGIDGIFTDRPMELIDFLETKGLHDNE